MAELGYTWYPQNWWTSETYKRLKRFPMVRYAIRELIDLMYHEGTPVEMNRDFLEDDFNIYLSDKEYEKLLEYVTVLEDGKWWIQSVKKRLSKAQAARENGKLGGAKKGNQNARKYPKKTTETTQKTTEQNNPNNPPLESKSKRESKNKIYKKFAHLSMTFDEFEKLNSTYTKTQIDEVLLSIQNYRQNTKYTSLYLTANNWLKKDGRKQSTGIV